MKLNNKGFAISTMMYIILVIALLLIVATLGMLSSRQSTLDKIKNTTLSEIKEDIKLKLYSNYSDECIKNGNICSMEQIKEGVTLDVAVNDSLLYKFNVINDDGNELTLQTVTSLSNSSWLNNLDWQSTEDHSDEITLTNLVGPITLFKQLETLTTSWTSISKISTYNYTDENLGYNSLSINEGTVTIRSRNNNSNEINNLKVRVATFSEMTNLGCTTDDDSCPSWLREDNFWLLTSSETDKAMYVTSNGSIASNTVDSEYGIKPVIVVNKSEL